MDNRFFEQPVLNSPYDHPIRHWELEQPGPTDAADHREPPARGVHRADSEARSGVHRHAHQAAEAAEAAGAQGEFREMHALLFERQQTLEAKDLIRYAGELALDVERFRHELKNETHSARVPADFLAGVQNGVYGTPGLFLNGVRYNREWDKESLLGRLNLISRDDF